MMSILRRVLGVGLAVCFAANSAVPGLLCGCGADEPVAPHSAHASMAGMEMSGAMPAGHDGHTGHGPSSHHTGPCTCIGHACGVSVSVLAAAPRLPGLHVVALDARIATTAPAAPTLRFRHVLPFAQAPPALS